MPRTVSNVVVVGAGLAGVRTCHELRLQGYEGRLSLLGAEDRLPYDRPPLSKALLLGNAEPADTQLDSAWYENVDLQLGVRALALRPGLLATTSGDISWDALVIATGASPIRLGVSRFGAALRTLDDALALRARFRNRARIVIVGAGWLGAEIATAAARHGCQVSVVEAGSAPLAMHLGASVGRYTAQWYADAGVSLLTHARVSTLTPQGVVLAGGEQLPADVVVESIGVRPDLEWLKGSAVEADNGVVVDAGCRTSLPGVFAVGDCAARWSPRAGMWLRGEHWDDALHAPEVTAQVLLGDVGGYDAVPYIWSEQFGRYLQWTGWRIGEPSVWRGEPGGEAWAVAWLDNTGRLTGMFAVDRPKDIRQARKAIASEHVPDRARLADPSVPVSQT